MAEQKKKAAKKKATRNAIFGLTDIQLETVYVPEWNMDVRVRGLTGSERDSWEAAQFVFKKGAKDVEIQRDNIRGRLLIYCLVDKEGNRLFNDDDAEELGKKSAAALDRLFAVAQQLCGLTNADVDDLVKN